VGNKIDKSSDFFGSIFSAAQAAGTAVVQASSGVVEKLKEEKVPSIFFEAGPQFIVTERDLAIMRRRSRIGESQADTVVDPAVLVVRKLAVSPDGSFGSFRRSKILEASLEWNAVLASNHDVLFATDHFLLQQATESDEEKIGPTYTFGQVKLFCGGRNPKMYSYGGHLVDNSIDGSAKAQWMDVYDRFLRGSKCVRNNAFAELYYRDQIRRGYLLHTNITEASQQPNRAQFAFSMHVIAEASTAVEQFVPLIPETVDGG
jgi:hypothetical protein